MRYEWVDEGAHLIYLSEEDVERIKNGESIVRLEHGDLTIVMREPEKEEIKTSEQL